MRKYIRFSDGSFKIFHHDLQHCNETNDKKVVSAGFVCMVNGKIHCIGESMSLHVPSLTDDAEKIVEWLGLN